MSDGPTREDERRMLEQKLREAQAREAKYFGIVENVTDWVWEVDENGRYTYASPRIRELLGYMSLMRYLAGRSPP
jgi:PAS domain S-box-containing protein